MKDRTVSGYALLFALVLGGCMVSGDNAANTGSGAGSGPGAGGPGAGGGPPTGDQTGVPCGVAEILKSQCIGCHGSTPSGGAPMPLVTYENLLAASPKGGTYAERGLVRMKDTVTPMPPKPAMPVSDADLATYQEWIDAGMPKGDCSAGTGGGAPSPYDTPEVCTSNAHWTLGDQESPDMHPGMPCIGCHQKEQEGPTFAFAGTVFPTAHEPDDCVGYDGTNGTSIIVIDNTGKSFTVEVRHSGNFFWDVEEGQVAFPIHAKVVRGDSERAMAGAVATGDCNSCHTLDGSGMPAAPGRIMAP